MTDCPDPLAAFIETSIWHGLLDASRSVLAAHPEVATSAIHAAAILGDEATVRKFLLADPRHATITCAPLGADALTLLCFSNYLRLDRTRSEQFVRTAIALLEAGASATTGFYDRERNFESALYGAAGVAQHAGLTRVLLDRGADPNDGEVAYHTPETYDNTVLKILVESGRLTADTMATLLLRKHDWHDRDGIEWLLQHGADPNRPTLWGLTALQQAIRRDNSSDIIELLLDHGADPDLAVGEQSAAAIAARRGRGDLLELFERRGIRVVLGGLDRLLAACARNDAPLIRAIVAAEPNLVPDLVSRGGTPLAEFAGNGNTNGVRQLLDLGVSVDARVADADGYWGLARECTALHVAAWRARHATVKFLVERGAPVNLQDGKGQAPLVLAVRACVDSYWTHLRSTESVEALLRGGASTEAVTLPSGYAEADELIRTYERRQDR